MVFALAGDSTMTKPLDNGPSCFLCSGVEASTKSGNGTSYSKKATSFVPRASCLPQLPSAFRSCTARPAVALVVIGTANIHCALVHLFLQHDEDCGKILRSQANNK